MDENRDPILKIEPIFGVLQKQLEFYNYKLGKLIVHFDAVEVLNEKNSDIPLMIQNWFSLSS